MPPDLERLRYYDLSLLQLERVPPGAMPATLGNSDTVRVGDLVLIVGAPYGLSHSMSAGWISARWPPNSVYRSTPNSSGRLMYEDAAMADLITQAHSSGMTVWAAYGNYDWPTLGCSPTAWPLMRGANTLFSNC